VATRFYRLGDASFWGDEVFTLKAAALPWSTLWVTAYNPTPPLYYSIIRLMMDVSVSEWWLRLPSAIFGTLTVLFAYLATKKISDSRAALASALLLTLSTINIEYSQEGRAYALVGMCIAMSFLGLACLNAHWRKGTSQFTFSNFLKEGGALYGIGVLAALYSHNTAVFFWIAAQFFFLGWWVHPFKFSRNLLATWFVVNFLVLLIWVPWLLASLQVIETDMFTWLRQYELQDAVRVWRMVNSIQPSDRLNILIDAVILLLTLWGWISLRKNVSMAVALFAMLIFSSVVIWAYGFIGTPVFIKRTVLWGSLFSFMLVGIGISRLPLLAGRLVLLALVCIGLAGFYNYNQTNMAENQDWRSPAMIFNQQGSQDDIWLFRTTWPAPAFLHYVDNDQTDRRVLGWSCRKRQPLFGKIESNDVYSKVAWSESNPGWAAGNITDSTVWVIQSECFDRESVDVSNKWLGQNWERANTYEFRRVALVQWVPKNSKQIKKMSE
jgi:Dolichyl-phosphate-mannose-protein mannosyltransferase